MKKMSEVFKLPVSVDHYGLNDANNQTLIDGFDALEVHLKAAAHAINHVDALANALAVIIESFWYESEDLPSEFESRAEVQSARDVLAAYRGEK